MICQSFSGIKKYYLVQQREDIIVAKSHRERGEIKNNKQINTVKEKRKLVARRKGK